MEVENEQEEVPRSRRAQDRNPKREAAQGQAYTFLLTLYLQRLHYKHCVKQRSLLEKTLCQQPAIPEIISKIQIGQRQVYEFQEGGRPLGLGDG